MTEWLSINTVKAHFEQSSPFLPTFWNNCWLFNCQIQRLWNATHGTLCDFFPVLRRHKFVMHACMTNDKNQRHPEKPKVDFKYAKLLSLIFYFIHKYKSYSLPGSVRIATGKHTGSNFFNMAESGTKFVEIPWHITGMWRGKYFSSVYFKQLLSTVLTFPFHNVYLLPYFTRDFQNETRMLLSSYFNSCWKALATTKLLINFSFNTHISEMHVLINSLE